MEDQKRKKTISTVELDSQKEHENYAPMELADSMGDDFMNLVFDSVEQARKEWKEGDFHVEFFFKREKLYDDMLRVKPIARKTCATPEFNHACIYYRREDDTIHLLWILPDEATCKSMILSYENLNEEQKSLIPYIVGKFDGSLLEMVKKHNKEPGLNDGIVLIKEEAEG